MIFLIQSSQVYLGMKKKRGQWSCNNLEVQNLAKGKTFTRANTHILLVGDPSLGKSDLNLPICKGGKLESSFASLSNSFCMLL